MAARLLRHPVFWNSTIVAARSRSMDRVWQALLVAAIALIALAWPVPYIARQTGRPRFVVVLVLAALAMAAFDASIAALGPSDAYERFLLGFRLQGAGARAVAAVDVALLAAAAWGLWHMRPWARYLGMIYLGVLIGSFLIWGVRGAGNEEVGSMMLWQMIVLPFLTFGLMYLQRGARYFRN